MRNTISQRKYLLPLLIAWSLIITLIVCYALFGSHFRQQGYVYIDVDDTRDSVLYKVRKHNRNISMLKLLVNTAGYKPRTGCYVIEDGESNLSFYRRLRSGTQTPVRLTVPATRTMGSFCKSLGKQLMCDSADIAAVFTGYNIIIPNTYEVYWNITPSKLKERLEREYEHFWTKERRVKAEALQLTMQEVITLASIVDSETSYNPEKPTIARLYLNRLRKGMKLQSDPTVIFAHQDFTIRRVTNNHLNIDSPYNTYLHAGLPPAPIRIASVAGIDAVLNAPNNNYIYMCAREDLSGTHRFAATYAEHQANARLYQQALNKLNIK